VLGQLVNTGVPAILPSMVGAIVSLIAIFTTRKKKGHSTKMYGKFASLLVGLFGAAFMFTAMAPATFAGVSSNFWTFNASTPESTSTNEDLNFDYQVSSVDSGDSYTVELFKDAALDDIHAIASANASGSFDVIFPGEGTFTYKLVATNLDDGDPIMMSAEMDITFDTTAPASPIYGESVRTGDSYKISFTAPSDVDVETILVFASTETDSVPLDLTTLIGVVPTTPDEAHTFDFDAPTSDQYYFAVIAVDAAGNFSDPVGDDVLLSVVSDVSEEDLESVLGAGTDSTTTTTEGDVETESSDDGDSFATGLGLAIILAILGYLAWLFLGKSKDDSAFDEDDDNSDVDDNPLF